ncbi:MAG: TPM domain-containing protein [Methyloceanibacter sp.]
MKPFTQGEQAEVAQAISRAERDTSGEIVVVVARASASYRAFALMGASLIALAVPLPLIHFTKCPVEYIYLAQLIVFLAGAVLTQWEPLRIAATPSSIKRARAHQRAVEQFLVQNLHTTEGRTGVLIYVSAAERYAEVIADDGIYRKVPPETWEELIANLAECIGTGRRQEGFLKAIETCGKILARHFPPGHPNADELPNHLIVLDGKG